MNPRTSLVRIIQASKRGPIPTNSPESLKLVEEVAGEKAWAAYRNMQGDGWTQKDFDAVEEGLGRTPSIPERALFQRVWDREYRKAERS